MGSQDSPKPEEKEESYDAILLLNNPFKDNDLGLVSDMSEEYSMEKAVKYYKRIFHIDYDEFEADTPFL